MITEKYMYLDRDGRSLPSGQGRTAKYKIVSVVGGDFVLMEKHKNQWSMVFTGKLKEVELWLERKKTQVEQPAPLPAKEFVHDITKALLPKISYLPGIDARQVNNYVYVLLCRNSRSERNRVINSRFVDQLGQPIYILYTGDFSKPVSLRCAHLVDSISQAHELYPDITQTRLPDPLQWSDDVSDYVWDPTMEILNLSDRVVEHIANERADRLSGILAELDTPTLLRNIKEALHTGQQKACRDCTYALPSYSRKHDNVSMLLPLHVYTKDSELPEAVMLLVKTLHGYSLVTLVTPEQAYISVRAFRDPEMTWLKGALV